MPAALPSETSAIEIAETVLAWPGATARRFTTGMAFFVYDVARGDDRAVVRIGRPEQADALQQGHRLMERLRPLGVPLPPIFATGTHDGLPYMVMARLPGTDLGDVMNTLDSVSLDGIAHAVAAAQQATARLGTGRRFGYAATAETAPHASWSDVVAGHVARSERRLLAAGLFPTGVVASQ